MKRLFKLVAASFLFIHFQTPSAIKQRLNFASGTHHRVDFWAPHEVFFLRLAVYSYEAFIRMGAGYFRDLVFWFSIFFNLPLRSFIASVWGFIKELSR